MTGSSSLVPTTSTPPKPGRHDDAHGPFLVAVGERPILSQQQPCKEAVVFSCLQKPSRGFWASLGVSTASARDRYVSDRSAEPLVGRLNVSAQPSHPVSPSLSLPSWVTP